MVRGGSLDPPRTSSNDPEGHSRSLRECRPSTFEEARKPPLAEAPSTMTLPHASRALRTGRKRDPIHIWIRSGFRGSSISACRPSRFIRLLSVISSCPLQPLPQLAVTASRFLLCIVPPASPSASQHCPYTQLLSPRKQPVVPLLQTPPISSGQFSHFFGRRQIVWLFQRRRMLVCVNIFVFVIFLAKIMYFFLALSQNNHGHDASPYLKMG